jgi:hypothetical protein
MPFEFLQNRKKCRVFQKELQTIQPQYAAMKATTTATLD